MRFDFIGKGRTEEVKYTGIEAERKRIYGLMYEQLKALGFFEKGYNEQREIWDALTKKETQPKGDERAQFPLR